MKKKKTGRTGKTPAQLLKTLPEGSVSGELITAFAYDLDLNGAVVDGAAVIDVEKYAIEV